MDTLQNLTIDTPEQTVLEFPLAGIGSRFLAILADTAIQIVTGIVVAIALLIILPISRWISASTPQWVIAILIFLGFVINSCYYAVFETIWNGQTPGKRFARIRVMKDDGRPISTYDAILRNLLRIVDQLPGLYGVGVISVLLSAQGKRLGDFLAGTVVVHERTLDGIKPQSSYRVDPSLPAFDASPLTIDELQLIETFMQRRESWDPGVRTGMASQIATRIGQRLGLQIYGWPRTENFLEAVLEQCRASGRFR